MSHIGGNGMSFFSGDPAEMGMDEARQQLDDIVQELASLDHNARAAVAHEDFETGNAVAQRVGSIIHNLTYGWTPTLIMHLAHHVNLARNEAGESAELFRTTGTDLKNIAILLEESGVPIEICMKVLDLAHRMITKADDSMFEPMPEGEDDCDC